MVWDEISVQASAKEVADRSKIFLQASDQGRSFHLVSKHPSSNSWIRDGAYVSFAEYRFAMKARLNPLPTKVVVKRAGNPQLDTTCPKCNSQPPMLALLMLVS